ncbi:hypothetical protein Tco_0146392 [Tanacetum coccineum]
MYLYKLAITLSRLQRSVQFGTHNNGKVLLEKHDPPVVYDLEETLQLAQESRYGKELRYVHSLGRDEGSLSLNELTDLCTSLSKKVESLESELKQTKQTYHAALTKLIKWVKKLEQTIKISQARRRAKVVISNVEEDEEDPFKQGKSLIEELDLDA